MEDQLIRARRDFEDSALSGRTVCGHGACRLHGSQAKYDILTQANQQQNNSGNQLSTAQRNFLSRRVAGGDEFTPQRMRDYQIAHARAVNAGLEVDSPAYFAAVEHHADHMGDGRQPPLNEREAARISGIDEQTYSRHAKRCAL